MVRLEEGQCEVDSLIVVHSEEVRLYVLECLLFFVHSVVSVSPVEPEEIVKVLLQPGHVHLMVEFE